MKKESKYTYEEMLQLLKNNTYAAPDVWERIEGELELSDQLLELPEHKAPEGLWDSIEEQLEEAPLIELPKIESPKKKLNTITLLTIGALIGMILLGGLQMFFRGEEELNFQYKSEIESASLLDNKIELDENINEVLQYIENNSFLFDEEQLTEFNTQLAEINEALEQLLEMQENYGSDQSSNKLMAKMEREKANLLKSMIARTG